MVYFLSCKYSFVIFTALSWGSIFKAFKKRTATQVERTLFLRFIYNMPAPCPEILSKRNYAVSYKPCKSEAEAAVVSSTICSRYVTVLFILLCTIISWGAIFYHYTQDAHLTNVIRSLERKSYQVMPHKIAVCDNIPDQEKFDCFPRGKVDGNSCTQRGCCWSPNKSSNAKVPLCFYPRNFQSYKVVQVKKYRGGINAILNITKNSVYPNDIKSVSVEITFETKCRLHVKVTDNENARYEPPEPKIPVPDFVPHKSMYKVLVHEDDFGFAVVRKDTGTIIFDTRNVGGFIFSDQLLQLSALLPSENIYGLGYLRLRTDWQNIFLFNGKSSSSMEHVDRYGAHPFYLALEEDAKAHGVLLLNTNAMDIVLQPAPAITYRTIGGILNFYFFLGPSPSDVVQQYTDAIGFTFMPPYWSFGFHLCRYGYHSLNDTVTVWRRNRAINIPYDVQWNDIDYMDNGNDFTIGKNFYGLGDFIDKLHEIGMRNVVILDPGVASRLPAGTYPPYDLGFKLQLFIKNSSGLPIEGEVWNYPKGTVFPDFTNSKTIPYWLEMISGLHRNISFDGLWLDMNEISADVYDFHKPDCEKNNWDDPPYVPLGIDKALETNNNPIMPKSQGRRLKDGTLCMNAQLKASLFYNIHNIYALEECIVTNYCLAELRKKRPFILSRSTFPGSGHVAAHWTGDIYSSWEQMRYSVAEVMAFNLFGIPMVGADICGFVGNTEEQLCTRWQQLGAFYPFSRNHNNLGNKDQDPAVWGPLLIASTRKALTWRYKLLPYLYTLFWQAHRSGTSVIRPLFFEFSEDKNTYSVDYQFLWGPALLILPVLTKDAVTVSSYFPKGIWFDVYSLKSLRSNGRNFTIAAPLNTIPLFIRAGYIIPYQEPAVTTTESRKNPFGLYVALNEKNFAFGLLFWDDGESFLSDNKAEYNLFHFECSSSKLTGILLRWSYQTSMKLNSIYVLGVTGNVDTVYINNESHKHFTFSGQNQTLLIQSANIDLSRAFKVTWK